MYRRCWQLSGRSIGSPWPPQAATQRHRLPGRLIGQWQQTQNQQQQARLSQHHAPPPHRKSSPPPRAARNLRQFHHSPFRFGPLKTSEFLGATPAAMEHLTETIKSLGLTEVPKFPDTYPELNPYDIYRSHIAELLAPTVGVDPAIAFKALQWTAVLDNGDLVLPIPALRLKGKKPNELAEEIIEKVCVGPWEADELC
jgi:hypothetical protein